MPSSLRSRVSSPWPWPNSRRFRRRGRQSGGGCQAAAAAAAAATSSAGRSATSTTPSPSGRRPTAGGRRRHVVRRPRAPPFLQCVLRVESGGNYGAVSPGGMYMGGFQFSQLTWNEAAQLAGMPQLINVPPNQATPAQQDDLAIALYQADGQQPWDDSCRNS